MSAVDLIQFVAFLIGAGALVGIAHYKAKADDEDGSFYPHAHDE